MQKTKYEVSRGCALCMMCVNECPQNAISITPGGTAAIDQEKCASCGICYDNCPYEAIKKTIIPN